MRVIVIGGGVVGAATALALVERGLEVTLVDKRERLAEDTSHANGGGVTPLHAEPWNGPGLPASLIGYLGRSDAPWRLPPGSLPSLGTWGLRFLAQSRQARWVDNARANIRLGLHSLEWLRKWRSRYGFDYAQTTSGSMQLYFSRKAFNRSLAVRQRLIDGLGEVEPLDVDAVLAREPALIPVAEQLAGGLFYGEHESGDAARFAQCAAEEAQRQGARLRLGESVEQVICQNGRFRAIETSHEMIDADACVIAAGPEAPALLEPLGLRLPIRPVRGYSATFELDDSAALPTLPLLDTERRFVTLRLGERRLRVAGLADFAGHRRAIPPARMDVLLAVRGRCCPIWPNVSRLPPAGSGPACDRSRPDGRPLLGETAVPGLYLNAGHGPMGWTMACGSASILSDCLTGRTPAIDLAAYDARR